MKKVEQLERAVKTQKEEIRTLKDLNLPSVKEVVDKDANSVLDEIESSILKVATSILDGDGFTYSLPNRSKANQLYVPELDRIVLKDSLSHRPFANTSTCRKTVITTRILQLVHELCLKRIHVTKRDLFYTDVKLFEKQAASDAVLEEMGCTLTLDCMQIVFDFMLTCSRHGRLHALQPQRHGLREGRRRWQAAV